MLGGTLFIHIERENVEEGIEQMKLGEFIAQSIENSKMRLDPSNSELTAIRGFWEKLPGGSMARWRRMWYIARWIKSPYLSRRFWQDLGRHALRMRALSETQPWINR